MPGFTRGAEEAEKAAESARSFSGRVPFLILKEDDSAPTFVRMLTDKTDWISVDVHISVPSKPRPEGFEEKEWPKALTYVCQNDKAFRLPTEPGEDPKYEEGYGHCYIHEKMKDQKDKFGKSRAESTPQVYALCVLRKPRKDPDTGNITGFQDITEEYKDSDGKTHNVPAIRLITQKWSNFFGPMNASAYVSGSVCDRDFLLRRKTNKDYDIAPAPGMPDHHPGSPSWKVYTDALALMNIDLEKIIIDASSPERYARFLDPSVKVEKKKRGEDGAKDETTAKAPEGAGEEPSAEELAKFTADMMASADTGAPAEGAQ